MKKLSLLFLALVASVSLWTACSDHVAAKPESILAVEPTQTMTYISDNTVEAVADALPPLPEATELIYYSTVEVEPVEEPSVSEEDIELLALLTMAEAEGEPEEGQRLVIDTVLNRADFGGEFPDNIHDVIYQKNQYAGMLSPRIDQCYVKEELVQLVREELENRTNYDVIFFNAGHYSKYGVPLFQLGNHYFSSYD